MSYAIPPAQEQRPTRQSGEVLRGEAEITDLLTALDDSDCRAVLEVTGDEPLSAKEIVERCDIPSSTAYRKIERLVDLGLLREGLRIRSSGKHASEYSCCIEGVELSIGEDGTELRVVGCEEL